MPANCPLVGSLNALLLTSQNTNVFSAVSALTFNMPDELTLFLSKFLTTLGATLIFQLVIKLTSGP